jgi:YD repeat-containing protein
MSEHFSRRRLLGGLLAFLAGLLHCRWPAPAPASPCAAAGNRRDVVAVDPLGSTTTRFCYDQAGNLTSINDPWLGSLTTVTYDCPGQRSCTTW